jgi:hypothetical protein
MGLTGARAPGRVRARPVRSPLPASRGHRRDPDRLHRTGPARSELVEREDDELPNTRSGKIMRRLLRDVAKGRALGRRDRSAATRL